MQENTVNHGNSSIDTEDGKLSIEKTYGQSSSICDLLEVGVDGEMSSSEGGKGQIARKLTFEHEIIGQHHKGEEKELCIAVSWDSLL